MCPARRKLLLASRLASPGRGRRTEQRRKQSYTALPAATQTAVYSQSEHLAACNHHLEIAEKFDSAVKRRLKRDAECHSVLAPPDECGRGGTAHRSPGQGALSH